MKFKVTIPFHSHLFEIFSLTKWNHFMTKELAKQKGSITWKLCGWCLVYNSYCVRDHQQYNLQYQLRSFGLAFVLYIFDNFIILDVKTPSTCFMRTTIILFSNLIKTYHFLDGCYWSLCWAQVYGNCPQTPHCAGYTPGWLVETCALIPIKRNSEKHFKHFT